MNRRDFLKVAAMGVTAGQQSWIDVLPSAINPSKKPNVLFIAVDDLNDWIGCLGGYVGVKTPNIDKLAARGVLFANAHSPAPICYPSRTSLMTGWYPSKTGIYRHESPAFKKMLPGIKTIPEHFKEHGYYTIGGGKVFHEYEPQLWDESIFFQRLSDKTLKLNDIKDIYPEDKPFDWGMIKSSEEDMPGGKTVKWATEVLERNYDKPLFLAVGFHEPHLAWYAPKKYFDMYPLDGITLPQVRANDLDDVPSVARQMAYSSHFGKSTPKELSDHQRILDKDLWRSAVQAFLADISFLDAMLGKLLDAFYQSKYAKDSIVVLWSDNGFHLGEKFHWRKATLWEEATRVPLIISSSAMKIGQICQQPVSLIDLYPTLLEMCGLPQPSHSLEGHSLTPLLENVQSDWKQVARTTCGEGNHAIRSKDWRYIRYKDGSEELYDHRVDPQEWNNLATQESVAKIKNELLQFFPISEKSDNWCADHSKEYAACSD